MHGRLPTLAPRDPHAIHLRATNPVKLQDQDMPVRIAQAVARVEARSSAELVTVLTPRSESYGDLGHWIGAAAALAGLTVAFYAPVVLGEAAVLAEITVLYVLGSWAGRRSPRLLCLLASSARLRRATRRAAQSAFFEERVDGTRGRTGILVHVSLLEGRLDLIPDAGVRAVLGEAPFRALERDFAASHKPLEERLYAALEALGELLAEPLPRGEDDEDELDDQPRIHEEPS